MSIKNLNDSPTRTGISAHFYPANEPPTNEDELKRLYSGPIHGYEQLKKFPKIYAMCPAENTIDEGFYFCDVCQHFNKISTTISNVIRHASTHDKQLKKEIIKAKDLRRSEKIDENLQSLTTNESKIISKHLHKFFLLNGIAFKKIDSEDLTSLTPTLMSRKELSDYSGIIANRVENKIFSELRDASNISASFDGWTGIDGHHYLGVTIRCIINDVFRWFTIDFAEVEEIHASAVEIGYLLTKSFREYGIIGRVRSVVSDSQAVMTCAAANIDIWSCECILHMLHTLLGSFIEGAKPLLVPFYKLAAHLSSSTNWTAYASKRNVNRIPSFTPIRWSSLLKTFQAINIAKPYIIEYATTVKKDDKEKFNVDYSIVTELLKPLSIFQNWLEGFEGDEFGSQSDFLNAWYAVNKAFQDLSNKRWNSAKIMMNEKKIELEKTHKNTFKYLAICAILNPNTCLKNMPEKIKKKSIAKIIEEMKNINIQKEENENEENLTRNGFKVISNGDPFEQLYTRVSECPGDLFEYWNSLLKKTRTFALAKVAIDYLSRLATSASTERLFSGSRRIQTFERVRLLPETLRDLVIINGNDEIAKDCFYE